MIRRFRLLALHPLALLILKTFSSLVSTRFKASNGFDRCYIEVGFGGETDRRRQKKRGQYSD